MAGGWNVISYSGGADVKAGKAALERHEAGDRSLDGVLLILLDDDSNSFCASIGFDRRQQLLEELQRTAA